MSSRSHSAAAKPAKKRTLKTRGASKKAGAKPSHANLASPESAERSPANLHGNVPDTSAVALLMVDWINDLEFEAGEKLLRLMESLEDHDDVQNVFVNFEVSDSLMQKMAG